MIPVFQYLLKVIIVSGILTGYYWICLRNKRFHHYNRFYLVGAIFLGWGLPLLNLQWFHITPKPASPIHHMAEIIYSSPNTLPQTATMSWDHLLSVALLVISIVLLLAFLGGILQLFVIKSKGKVTPMERFDFIETSLEGAPFSFFRNLFWKKECVLNDENGQRILQHEITHIEQYHSLDKVLATISTCLGWMNPFFWLIRKELEVVHEFIADESVIADNDASKLAEMLLIAQYAPSLFSNGQSFFYSSIKRRIIMLSSSKKTSYSYARRLLVLPISLCALALLSFTIRNNVDEPKQSYTNGGTNTAIFLDTIPSQFRDAITGKLKGNYQVEMQADSAIFKDHKSKKILFKVPLSQLGEMAGKNSGNKSGSFEARKKAILISGDSITFLDGTKINDTKTPRIIVNGYELTEPFWELHSMPASSITTIDIRGSEVNIKIDSSKRNQKKLHLTSVTGIDTFITENKSFEKVKDANTQEKDGKTPSEHLIITKKDADGKVVYTYTQKYTAKDDLPKDILYVIDGQESDAATFKNLDPNSIRSVTVLKGKSSSNKYGDKGQNGVIEIIIKK